MCQEADQQTIELFEDDTQAVRAMMKFAYTQQYRDQLNRGDLLNSMTADPLFYLQVYAIVSKYGFQDLQQSVQRDFEDLYPSRLSNKVLLQIAVTTTALMCEFFPNPPSDLANALHGRLTWEMDMVLSTPELRAEVMKIVSTNDKTAEALASTLFKHEQLEACHLQKCSNCGNLVNSEQVACGSGMQACSEAEAIPMRYYMLKVA